MTFALTPKQTEANDLLGGSATHLLLYGGSRSGKTALFIRAMIIRGFMAPRSRHACFRFRMNAVRQSIVGDTFPKVMEHAFPGIPYDLNKSELFATLPNRSEIWFAGLDDKERTEKVLGLEFATILLNEISQIPYASRELVRTRLAQNIDVMEAGKPVRKLALKAYYDENPPAKSHWSYSLWFRHVDPESKRPLSHPSDYASMQMNPVDNVDNLPAKYLQELQSMAPRMRKRFYEGAFRDDTDNTLFPEAAIDRYRVTDGVLPDMVRIVVVVDPSGADDEDNADNDEIGLGVVGLGTDGNGYFLEDLTVKAGPATWGKVATDAYDRHQADAVAAETNFGGAMVRYVIQSARPRTNFIMLTASRGKVQRAEPISSLVETGKARLVGYMPELEEELSGFTAQGFVGDRSPNRADVFIWGMSVLFQGIVAPRKEKAEKKDKPVRMFADSEGWMQ